MRFIYIDEAGTSAPEPVTVVVAIIVHADKQWLDVAGAIYSLHSTVPEAYRHGFISHATTIWGSPKYRDHWSREDRTEFLYRMMSIPRLLGLGIAFGFVRRDCPVSGDLRGLTIPQIQHAYAFGSCIGMADMFMRDHGDPNELATVVAEDLPEMREALRQEVFFLSQSPQSIPPETLVNLPEGKNALRPADNILGVSRVIDTIHFAAKNQATILQVTDACAFAYRRFFACQSNGVEFMNAVLGGNNPREHNHNQNAPQAGSGLMVYKLSPNGAPVSGSLTSKPA